MVDGFISGRRAMVLEFVAMQGKRQASTVFIQSG
jgi:hypothetical protein